MMGRREFVFRQIASAMGVPCKQLTAQYNSVEFPRIFEVEEMYMSRNIAKETAALMHLDPFAVIPPGLAFTRFADDKLREAIGKNINAITAGNGNLVDCYIDDDTDGINEWVANLASQVRGLQQMLAVAGARNMSVYF